MITPESYYNKDNVYCSPVTLFGLSTDTKPTNVPNGSVFFEIDNFGSTEVPYIFMFDAENSKWYPETESDEVT